MPAYHRPHFDLSFLRRNSSADSSVRLESFKLCIFPPKKTDLFFRVVKKVTPTVRLELCILYKIKMFGWERSLEVGVWLKWPSTFWNCLSNLRLHLSIFLFFNFTYPILELCCFSFSSPLHWYRFMYIFVSFKLRLVSFIWSNLSTHPYISQLYLIRYLSYKYKSISSSVCII